MNSLIENNNKRGRPTKYTSAVVKRVMAMIALGLTQQQAADAAGIHRDTLAEWKKTKPAFSDSLEKARSKGIAERLRIILKAASNGSWQAAAWWLERNCSDQWAKKKPVENTIPSNPSGEHTTVYFNIPSNGREAAFDED